MIKIIKKMLALTLTAVLSLSAFAVSPLSARAAADYHWDNSGDAKISKFNRSNGTFTIENTGFGVGMFCGWADVGKAGVYQVSAEVKIENFKTNPANPQEFTVLRVVNRESGEYVVSVGAERGGAWEAVSGVFIAEAGARFDLELCLGDGKGKATFRNFKIDVAPKDKQPIIDTASDGKLVYRNKMIRRDYDVKKDSEWAKKAKNISIKDFGLPDAIGKTTLSYDAAFALVGKKPADVAESVKTVGDVLQYFIASRFGYKRAGGDDPNDVQILHVTGDTAPWGFDPPGDEQLTAGYNCCCGGMGSAVAYLLAGDYEKVGVLQWQGTSHVINWVKTNGKYYIFDFVALCAGGEFNVFDYPVTVTDKLEDFFKGGKLPNWYYERWSSVYDSKSVFNAVYAYETSGAVYPHWWGDLDRTPVTLPTFAKGKVTTIYLKNKGKGIAYRDLTLPEAYNFWNLPAPKTTAKP